MSFCKLASYVRMYITMVSLQLYTYVAIYHKIIFLQYADVEEDCDDGVWFGVKYYDCKPNKGMFVHLSELKPAMRKMKITEGT